MKEKEPQILVFIGHPANVYPSRIVLSSISSESATVPKET